MLYVFHVDTGTMMTFDMTLAMEKVSNLQSVIARGCRIQEDKQVLLISGGESLDPTSVVGRYHAGTDTNPIYLFSKSTIEAATPPSPSVNYGSDIDLQSQVEGSLLMPPAYETVVSRAQLALQFQEVDVEELRACERLIHDQHLQQQGWAAVVANLEDITGELRQRSGTFQEAYTQYLGDRQTYRALIASVSVSLQLLSKIPLLPSLSPVSPGPSPRDSGATSQQDSTDSSDKSSLFDWINSQDTNHSLQDMVEQCDKATEQLDENVGGSLKGEVEHLFKEVLNENMKEVKGLEDRLYGLDQIISGARKLVQEQGELAQGFVHNQNRASDLRDRSILPDLCSSHRSQLVEMLKNHTRLREIKKKCRMAKEELSINLHTRLRWIMYVEKKICDVDGKLTIYLGNLKHMIKWIMYVEKKICDVDGKLTIYLGNLKRMIKRLDILKQVHDAPRVYAQMLIEVVRRRKFSNQFLSWAVSLAEDSSKLHTDEMRRREAFLIDIGHHFLQSMFQGLDECVLPAFATEAPSVFDQNLPNITVDDIKQLKENVPELSGVLSLPVDEDFFQDFLHIKDSLVQLSEHHLALPPLTAAPTTITNSELDMVQIDRLQPYSLDGGSVSLGDQFTECEGEEIIPKPGFDSLSPPDKEFMLAKSLSEELTKEMKEEQKLLKQKSLSDLKALRQASDTPDGKGGKSRDPVAHLRDQTSRARRTSSSRGGVAELSPDMETSQEFSTADFYIDESMPSSIESPPKTSTCTEENKENLEEVLEDERNTVKKLQEELKECNLKLSVSECKIKSLKQLVDDKLPELKEAVKGFKTQHSDSKERFEEELGKLKDSLAETLRNFGESLSSDSQAVIDRMVHERQESDKALNEKLVTESTKAATFEQQVEILNQQLSEKETVHKEEMDKLVDEKSDLGAKLAKDIQELTLQHELELEVETDKVKSELEAKLEQLDKELEAKDNEIKDKESAINNFKVEKVKLEEALTEKFQREKDEICTLLGNEYDEKMANTIEDEKQRLDEKLQKLKEELQKSHEADMQQKIDILKQSFIQEKQEAVEMTQSVLTEEHAKTSNEIKQKIAEEKETDFNKHVQELESKFQEDMTKLSTEFNKEKEALVKELETYRNKDIRDCENQTSLSVFNLANCDCQTEPDPVRLETQVQTEACDQSHVTSQTDTKEHVQLSTQTETSQISNLSVQTELVEHTQLSTQTDTADASNTSMQTDTCEFKTPVENQSDTFSQTDSKLNNQSGTQTEPVIVDQSKVRDQAVSGEHMKTSDDAQVDYAAKIDELQKAFEKKLAEVEQRHTEEMEHLVSQLEQEKEGSIQLKTSLTSIAGDKQVIFNEAVNKVCQGKDKIIEELKAKEAEYLAQKEKDIETLEQLRKEKAKVEDVKDRALAFLKDKEAEHGARQRQLETELGASQQQVQVFREQLQNVSSDILEASANVATSPSVVKISEGEDPEIQQRIKDLEDVVRLKDEELNKMQQKVMELSMSASTRSLVQDKVSITSCHVGDLVLLCLDERLDQYVVFTVGGTTLHFLHTDCLAPLALKVGAGETRKQWLIAEVTDKEYCQAKKPNNRFRVPVGTKFYRVKAKKWSRETMQSPAKKSDTASGGS